MTVVLDYISALIPMGLDVEGNAQHWFIRTAEAATETTIFTWLGKFSTQEDWDTLCATPAANAWAPYLKSTGVTRRGLDLNVAKAKHDKRLSTAWGKALVNWVIAFRDEGDHFFERLQQTTPFYAEATQEYLGYMGLRIRDWLGSIAIHIMLLCGNREAGDWLGNRVSLAVLHFPDPPIIPVNLRVFLNQELMAVLARNLYRQMPQPDMAQINELLDVILTAYLNPFYAPPPFSFLHLEHPTGFWQLHSHIVSAFEIHPPQVRDWHVPFLQPLPPGSDVLLVPDLFTYVTPGDVAVDTLTLIIERYSSNVEDTLVMLHRSDTSSLDVQLNSPVPNVVTMPVPPGGTTWQIVLRTGSIPTTTLVASLDGTFFATDTVGQLSNTATWLIRGAAPVMQQVIASVSLPPLPAYLTVVYADLLDRAIPGEAALATMGIVINEQVGNFIGFEVFLHRSDSGVADINLTANPYQLTTVPVPTPGVTWQLVVDLKGVLSMDFTVYFIGNILVTDTLGIASNVALLSLVITP